MVAVTSPSGSRFLRTSSRLSTRIINAPLAATSVMRSMLLASMVP